MRTSDIQLRCSTGYPNVDQLLIDLIGNYERSFPDRIRGYYLVGSYSDRSAVPDSDIDMGVLFKGSLTDDERQRFRQLTHERSLLSPVRLDCSALDEAHFLKEAAAGAKMALVVYGEDVLDQIP
jgi:predicted nucleotidyltransferase